MNKKLQKLRLKIFIAAFLFIAAFFPLPQILRLVFLGASYLIIGKPILQKAWRNIIRGQIFDENFLMMIATFGAFALGEYSEAVAVMLFFQIGEFFQAYAVNQSRRSIAALMNIRPDYAHVRRGEEIFTLTPEDVKIGEIIIVKPGERIPLDGVVIKGASTLDTSALTGESIPQDVEKGSAILSGSINLTGILEIRTTEIFATSTIAKILELVENASSKKANIENFITRFARYYTPAVVIFAAVLAFLPPLISTEASFKDWAYRAITFLVISCPCALVISIPLSFFGGLGAASRNGILIKGSNYLEGLAKAKTIVFDKTGTLTKGKFGIAQIIAEPHFTSEQILDFAAHIEAQSNHPIAFSILQAYAKKPDSSRVQQIKEHHGRGITALIDKKEVAAGNSKLLQELGINPPAILSGGTAIFVAIDHQFAGYILLEDEIKEDAAQTIIELKKQGIKQTIMLSGDRQSIAEKVGKGLKLDKVYAELLPLDKVNKIEEILTSAPSNSKVIFVGDGINDAPVLARSDIGIAMGGVGSDAAIEAADIVIMTDEPSKIITAIKIAQKTLFIAKENIAFALGVKFIVLGLGAAGYASIWAAVFADVGVSLIAILNAVRILGFRPKS